MDDAPEHLKEEYDAEKSRVTHPPIQQWRPKIAFPVGLIGVPGFKGAGPSSLKPCLFDFGGPPAGGLVEADVAGGLGGVELREGHAARRHPARACWPRR